MEPKFQTSFIPKQSITNPSAPRRIGGNAFFAVAFTAFVLTALAFAGVWFYERRVEASLADMKVNLDKARANFEPTLLSEVRQVNTRIVVGKTLLSKHLAPTAVFSLLEKITVASVSFSSFDLAVNEQGDIRLALKGIAKGFNAVALQSDIFSREKYFKGPIFSNFKLDDVGMVTFDITTSLDPTLLSFEATLPKVNTGNGNESSQNNTAPDQSLDQNSDLDAEFNLEDINL